MIVTVNADARSIPLADESVQCVVTSPPYWGLRDYGVAGQIGLERTPEEYVETLVGVFREVRRVLKKDGTVFLNLGDSYARDAKKGQHKVGDTGKQAYIYDTGGGRASACLRLAGTGGSKRGLDGGEVQERAAAVVEDSELRHGDHFSERLKPKDLVGIPWRVAFALQADGWWLRSDIVWAKPNPMPESVTDRPTRSHEYVFLLTKAQRYYYDAAAIRTPQKAVSLARGERGRDSEYAPPGQTAHRGESMVKKDKQRGHSRRHDGFKVVVKFQEEDENMRVFWWQGGLHLEPASEKECDDLEALVRLLDGSRIDQGAIPSGIPTVHGHDENAIIGVHELKQMVHQVEGVGSSATHDPLGQQDPLRS